MSYVRWKKNKNLFNRIKKELMVLFLIFGTDTFLFNTNINVTWEYISKGMICCGVCWFILKYRKQTEKKVLELFFICGLLMISMIVSRDFTGGYIFKIILLAFGFYFTREIPFDEFRKYYIYWMKVIAINSLVGLVLCKFIVNSSLFPIMSNGIREVKMFGLTNITVRNDWTAAGTMLYRNYGPFWEPGVYQIYLILALAFSMFSKEKVNIFDAILFTCAIVSTFSTTGYIVMVLIYIAFFMQKKGTRYKLIVCLGGIVFLVAFFNMPHLVDFVFSKLSGKGSSAASFNARWYSIWINLYIAISKPFGVGPNGLETNVQNFLKTNNIDVFFTNVNMITQQFAIFGILFGGYYVLKLCGSVNKIVKSNIGVKAILYFILIIELFSEPLIYSLLFNTILFYSREEIDGGNLKNYENSLAM